MSTLTAQEITAIVTAVVEAIEAKSDTAKVEAPVAASEPEAPKETKSAKALTLTRHNRAAWIAKAIKAQPKVWGGMEHASTKEIAAKAATRKSLPKGLRLGNGYRNLVTS